MTAFLGSKDNLFVVSPGDKPVAQKVVQNKANDSLDLLYNSVPPGIVEWDEYLRVAASAVLNEHRRKAVIVFVDSLPGKDAFDVYGLVQTARLMANNDVIFYAVYLVDNVSPELEYIVSETGGESCFIYQPEEVIFFQRLSASCETGYPGATDCHGRWTMWLITGGALYP